MGRSWRMGIDPAEKTSLVTRGPYRWMRHPIYRAVALEVPALAAALGAWTTATVGAILQLAALRLRIAFEEKALEARTPTV